MLDSVIGADGLRRFLQRKKVGEQDLLPLFRYFVLKDEPQVGDLERIEVLLAFVFRCRRDEKGWMPDLEIRNLLGAWLGDDARRPGPGADNALQRLGDIQHGILSSRTFAELVREGWIARGRRAKQRLLGNLLHPESLCALVTYNMLVGDKFQELAGAAVSNAGLPAERAHSEYRASEEEFTEWLVRLPQPVRSPGLAAAAGTPTPAPRDGQAPGEVRSDPNFEEARFSAMLARLVTLAQENPNAEVSVPLSHSVVPLSALEVSCLATEFPVGEKSFRAELARAVKLGVALRVALTEESDLYDVRRAGAHLWKKHLTALTYLSRRAEHVLPELEFVHRETTRRGLHSKADQLAEATARLRSQLEGAQQRIGERQGDSGPAPGVAVCAVPAAV